MADNKELILQWLTTVFGNEPVPHFNDTPDLMAQLHDLMVRYKSSENAVDAYQSLCATSQKHFAVDQTNISELLHYLGVKPSLPNYLTPESEHLSRLAEALSLSNTDSTSYVLALSQLSLNKEKTITEYEFHQKCVEEKEKELAQAINSVKRLENMAKHEEVKRVESVKTMSAHENEASFLKQKITKYKTDKSASDRKLSESGLTRDLTHDKLVGEHRELQGLQAKLEQTREHLDMYASLPPDKELAQVKLAVAKAELQELEEKLVRQCDLFHL